MDAAGTVADWRDADAYARLLDADRPSFAWEWLRRDPSYRVAAAREPNARGRLETAAAWGLHRFEDPSSMACDARPLWRAEDHPYVLKASARPAAAPADALDLRRLGACAVLDTGQGEHWLLGDGLHSLRLDLVSGSGTRGPVELSYLLAGRAAALGPLLTLRRLLALAESGRFSRSLHRREPRGRRWILALRTHDALAAGASQRDIAAALLGAAAAEGRWRVEAASLRLQVQRLVRTARGFAKGGYRDFLR